MNNWSKEEIQTQYTNIGSFNENEHNLAMKKLEGINNQKALICLITLSMSKELWKFEHILKILERILEKHPEILKNEEVYQEVIKFLFSVSKHWNPELIKEANRIITNIKTGAFKDSDIKNEEVITSRVKDSDIKNGKVITSRVKDLVEKIKHPDITVNSKAIKELLDIGSPAIPILRKIIRDPYLHSRIKESLWSIIKIITQEKENSRRSRGYDDTDLSYRRTLVHQNPRNCRKFLNFR